MVCCELSDTIYSLFSIHYRVRLHLSKLPVIVQIMLSSNFTFVIFLNSIAQFEYIEMVWLHFFSCQNDRVLSLFISFVGIPFLLNKVENVQALLNENVKPCFDFTTLFLSNLLWFWCFVCYCHTTYAYLLCIIDRGRYGDCRKPSFISWNMNPNEVFSSWNQSTITLFAILYL